MVGLLILSNQALAGASFTSPQQVCDQIDAFIIAYNRYARSFEWTTLGTPHAD